MLIFGVAKPSFTMEWGFGVTIKWRVKEAKCQVIVAGYMLIRMEKEEFHGFLSLTLLHLTINSTLKTPPLPVPKQTMFSSR